MIAVKRELVPENGMDFSELCSFLTASYVGVYDHGQERFVVFAQSDSEFFLSVLDKDIDSLQALDDAVYEDTGEHIISVSDSQRYAFKLLGDNASNEADKEYVRRAV